jgi:predicted DCC family thiol-disulfide oxidoreductase YuxK
MKPVILFDGVCNYCNFMVNFAIRHDKKGRLQFAPLQSDTGKAILQQYQLPPDTDSVVFIDQGKVMLHSDAALGIARYLDWPAKILYGFIIIPRFIRNPFYKWIAKNRYRFFGKKETCMIPTPDVKSRFLD